jgi:hypothetical protein
MAPLDLRQITPDENRRALEQAWALAEYLTSPDHARELYA